MRHISGCVGNLAKTPKLREGENGPYTFATVMVSDRIKTKSGAWEDGPSIAYNVAVKGDEAKRLVAAATRDGNLRVTFSGRYRVTEWQSENGPREQHEVQADSIGLSFRGQNAGVFDDNETHEGAAPATAADSDNEPVDIFEAGVES